MLTGRKITLYLHNTESSYLSPQDNMLLPQGDTIRNDIKPAQSKILLTPSAIKIPGETTRTSTTYSQTQLDSIFSRAEQREQQIKLTTNVIIPVKKEVTKLPLDTISTKYNAYNFPVSSIEPVASVNTKNILQNIPYKTYSLRDLPKTKQGISIISNVQTATLAKNQAAEQNLFVGTLKYETGMNWLTIILLVSLFTFSLLRISYQKFIVQIVGSLINYQLSNRLFRERNVLFKNISLGLNFIFALNFGLFIFYTIEYFGLNQVLPGKFLSMSLYTIGILTIYTVKSLYCKFIGYVFLVQEAFDEYLHNINLFNKNIGLFLFPIVIIYPFIHVVLQPFILYTGLGIVLILFLLRTHRGFQIILKKGISFFYLILYLCAVEILPVLLLLKYSGTLN